MSELIVMLTHSDVTVPDAMETSLACRDLPIKYWGFKGHGVEPNKMKELIQCMKDNRKTTFLKVVSYTEAKYIRGAKLAVECGFDYLVGTIFYDNVLGYIGATGLKYYPFAGTVTRNPSILQGTVQEMLDQEAMSVEKDYMEAGLLRYRYMDGDPTTLSAECIAKAEKSVILTSSTGSDGRITEVLEMNPWTFIIGGALFARKFVGDGSLRWSLEYILGLLK